MISMREIKPSDVHSCVQHLDHFLFRGTGRPQCADNLRFPLTDISLFNNGLVRNPSLILLD